jgi:polynucleotide 5'-hydroxyl-kinase GRC3/NOL9
MSSPKSENWAEKTANRIIEQDYISRAICLILGASDTGKTFLVEALSKKIAHTKPLGIVDADIGQSHIGPPTTVGWAIYNNPKLALSNLTTGGISFVGHVTPVGHLLQLTSAITQCIEQVKKHTDTIIIDTPGLVSGGPAAALWWTIQMIIKPEVILAVQRHNELNHILKGLILNSSSLRLIKSPPNIPVKSPQQRQNYRFTQFAKYFQNSLQFTIDLNNVSIQMNRRMNTNELRNRIIALRDIKSNDLAIGIIDNWQDDKNTATIIAPRLDLDQVRCLVVGDITFSLSDRP